MKRIISIIATVLLLASLLTACGKFECELCGKDSRGKKYTKEVLGREITYCKECNENLNDLADLFE